MKARPEGDVIWRGILARDFDTTMRLSDCPKPTIAAVHGACLAGAFEIALACDITIAAESAVFGEPELKFGAGIVPMSLPWMTGPKQAKKIVLNALNKIDAHAARELGLVDRVVAEGERRRSYVNGASDGWHGSEPCTDTKTAINQSFEVRGMKAALQNALDLDHSLKAKDSPDKQTFVAVARKNGMREAMQWRDLHFSNE